MMIIDKIAIKIRETGKPVHFLHIGKAGGTAIKFMMAEAGVRQLKFRFVAHSHRARLTSIPMGEPYFFHSRPHFAFCLCFLLAKAQGTTKDFCRVDRRRGVRLSQVS